MPIENALSWIVVALALVAAKIGSVGIAIWLDEAAPAFMARARIAYLERAKRSFVLGLINGVGVLFICAVLGGTKIKVLGLVVVLSIMTLVAAIIVGYGCAYYDLGRRFGSRAGWSPQRQLLLGGLTAEAAFLAPIIGQVFSIGVLFRGLGAVIAALMSRTPPPAPSPTDPHE